MLITIGSLGLSFSLVGTRGRVLDQDGVPVLDMAVTDMLARPNEVLTDAAIDRMSPQEQVTRLQHFAQLPCCQRLLSRTPC